MSVAIICDTCAKAATCKDKAYLGAWCPDWEYGSQEDKKEKKA